MLALVSYRNFYISQRWFSLSDAWTSSVISDTEFIQRAKQLIAELEADGPELSAEADTLRYQIRVTMLDAQSRAKI